MDQLIINANLREKRFALIKNGEVEKIYIEQPGQQSLVGNIYLGIVEKVIPGMNAAFVNFGEGTSGFLQKDKLSSYILSEDENKANRPIGSYVHQGEKLLVQVEKDAAGTKGARLTGVIELPGEHIVYMPKGKYIAVSKKADSLETRAKWKEFGVQVKTAQEGLIFRTESLNQPEAVMIKELEQQRSMYAEIEKSASGMKKPGLVFSRDYFFEQVLSVLSSIKNGTVIVDCLDFKKKIEHHVLDDVELEFYNGKVPVFSFYKIEPEIERLLKRIVWLDKGAYMVIDQGEALTMIDVNTGKFSGKTDLRDTVLITNMNAAVEAARQIRLRDLAGIILIDFIDMKSQGERDKVLKHIQKELLQDGRRTRIIGFTELGILQLTRKKTKQSMAETLTEKCGTCGGTGQVLSSETVAYRLERELWEYKNSDYEEMLISASDEVVRHFSGEADIHKLRLEKALGFKMKFSVSDAARPFYEILQVGASTEQD
ncbi:Rne/Rng family ribonuclease [Bacillus sp. ISL-35]|uniref:Rne/Rng family ribonuclease n=1 Tax=Bacillus sp. ISL-35 TaxID=2819122 RepID=UPI001BE541B9|nr:Rne/Rng family ribonuclease [Bacillus sp. ISL-35]MBT2681669.1 Rne/Rng family ribonuclease [Bacillus sp. ISL-35]MBT2702295.1 Rne/Rng family ribonuclease [Chryseobacterium sp. ISL-80]